MLFIVWNIKYGFLVFFYAILIGSLYELYRLFNVPQRFAFFKISILSGLFMYVYIVLNFSPINNFFNSFNSLGLPIILAILFYTILLIFDGIIQKEKKALLFKSFSLFLFSIAYIFIPIILNLSFVFSIQGVQILIYEIMLCKIADTGALVVGKRYGKLKLVPTISPNKTFEGLIGSFLFGMIVVGVFYVISSAFKKSGVLLHFIMGSIFILVNNFGDLFESFLKRRCNVKDSSNLLGEIGGFLDLIDGILIVSFPMFWYNIYLTRIV
jgi:phosphatidate cytidylyltransferase